MTFEQAQQAADRLLDESPRSTRLAIHGARAEREGETIFAGLLYIAAELALMNERAGIAGTDNSESPDSHTEGKAKE